MRERGRVFSRYLCEAEAPTETKIETRKSESMLSYGELFQRSSRQDLLKRRGASFSAE